MNDRKIEKYREQVARGARVDRKAADQYIRAVGGDIDFSGNGGSHARKVVYNGASAPLPAHGKEYPGGTLRSALKMVGIAFAVAVILGFMVWLQIASTKYGGITPRMVAQMIVGGLALVNIKVFF